MSTMYLSKDCDFKTELFETHWGRMTHVCVSKLAIIVSDNGRRLAIIWTIARILLNDP